MADASGIASVSSSQKPRRRRTCKGCKQQGHDVRTCPSRGAAATRNTALSAGSNLASSSSASSSISSAPVSSSQRPKSKATSSSSNSEVRGVPTTKVFEEFSTFDVVMCEFRSLRKIADFNHLVLVRDFTGRVKHDPKDILHPRRRSEQSDLGS